MLIIGGYSKFWFTQIYYNLIIAMLFDVAVSVSNFNKCYTLFNIYYYTISHGDCISQTHRFTVIFVYTVVPKYGYAWRNRNLGSDCAHWYSPYARRTSLTVALTKLFNPLIISGAVSHVRFRIIEFTVECHWSNVLICSIVSSMFELRKLLLEFAHDPNTNWTSFSPSRQSRPECIPSDEEIKEQNLVDNAVDRSEI